MCNDTSLINNKIDDNDTSYIEHNDMVLALLNQPNRETRRKENKLARKMRKSNCK